MEPCIWRLVHVRQQQCLTGSRTIVQAGTSVSMTASSNLEVKGTVDSILFGSENRSQMFCHAWKQNYLPRPRGFLSGGNVSFLIYFSVLSTQPRQTFHLGATRLSFLCRSLFERNSAQARCPLAIRNLLLLVCRSPEAIHKAVESASATRQIKPYQELTSRLNPLRGPPVVVLLLLSNMLCSLWRRPLHHHQRLGSLPNPVLFL